MGNDKEWTAAQILQLREYHGALTPDGSRPLYSANEIARRMKRTKNSVIGKARRLNLPARPSPIARKDVVTRPRRPRPSRKIDRPVSNVTILRPAQIGMIAEKPVIAAPPPRPVVKPMLVRTSAFSCCFPIGEPRTPEFRWCDARALVGKSYCFTHYRLTHRSVDWREIEKETA